MVKGPQKVILSQQEICDKFCFINAMALCLAQGHTAGESGMLIQ